MNNTIRNDAIKKISHTSRMTKKVTVQQCRNIIAFRKLQISENVKSVLKAFIF